MDESLIKRIRDLRSISTRTSTARTTVAIRLETARLRATAKARGRQALGAERANHIEDLISGQKLNALKGRRRSS
jgi:hypothetical protein